MIEVAIKEVQKLGRKDAESSQQRAATTKI